MNKILLFIILCISFSGKSQTYIQACDLDGNGIETVDLTTKNDYFTNVWQMPPGTTVTYYPSEADAWNNINPISNPTSYITGTAYLGVVVEGVGIAQEMLVSVNTVVSVPEWSDLTVCGSFELPPLNGGNYYTAPGGTGTLLPAGTVLTTTQTIYIFASCVTDSETDFVVTFIDTPEPQIQDGTICREWGTNELLNGYLLETGLDPSQYTFQWSVNGVLIAGAIGNSFLATLEGQYSVQVSLIGGACYSTATANVGVSGPPVIEDIIIDNQDITIDVAGFGNYQASIDGGPFSPSMSFTGVSLGTHVIVITDTMGCGSISVTVDALMPNPPSGETLQSFVPGETLADLSVAGENIQWYTNPSDTGRMMDVALPLSTILVDGTTYYASQTINGIESEDRFPVTVTTSLGLSDNAFKDFSFSPNPVKDVLLFSNSKDIKEINVYNLLGQLVTEQNDYSISQIDLSAIRTGIYLVKVSSGNAEKTIRIIKE